MKLLEDRILKDAKIISGTVLKVDSFLNQSIDTELAKELAMEFKRLYGDEEITKILTVESSGIGLAAITALIFEVPLVFAKKTKNIYPSDGELSSRVTSLTHGTNYNITLPSYLLSDTDKVLIIDDFLANGSALSALIKLCRKAECEVVGAGVAIEKSYQRGGSEIRSMGYRVEALAKIKSMESNGKIEFC